MRQLVTRYTNKANALFFALFMSLMASPAFAQTTEFDGSDIIAKVVAYTAIGVAILAAFALGRWTLRALGLIGGK